MAAAYMCKFGENIVSKKFYFQGRVLRDYGALRSYSAGTGKGQTVVRPQFDNRAFLSDHIPASHRHLSSHNSTGQLGPHDLGTSVIAVNPRRGLQAR
jgi:hypothetical protein